MRQKSIRLTALSGLTVEFFNSVDESVGYDFKATDDTGLKVIKLMLYVRNRVSGGKSVPNWSLGQRIN